MKLFDVADAISEGCQQSVMMDVIKYNYVLAWLKHAVTWLYPHMYNIPFQIASMNAIRGNCLWDQLHTDRPREHATTVAIYGGQLSLMKFQMN